MEIMDAPKVVALLRQRTQTRYVEALTAEENQWLRGRSTTKLVQTPRTAIIGAHGGATKVRIGLGAFGLNVATGNGSRSPMCGRIGMKVLIRRE